MKRILPPLAVALGLAGCGAPDTVVVATVTAEPAVIGVIQLRLTLSNSGRSDAKLYPQSLGTEAISFPTGLAIVLPRGLAGALDLAVDGLNTARGVVANGSARAVLRPGARTDVTVRLVLGASQCGNRTIEGGETCDDGNRVTGDGCDFMCHLEGAADGGSDGVGDGADRSAESADLSQADLRDTGPDTLAPEGPVSDPPPESAIDPAPDAAVDPAVDALVDAVVDPVVDAAVDAVVDMPLAALGAPCGAAAQCASGYCANSVCCDTACNSSLCYACDLSGKVGTCSFACTGSMLCSTSCGAPARCCP